jgi:probable HAF family extracellular repeat protein
MNPRPRSVLVLAIATVLASASVAAFAGTHHDNRPRYRITLLPSLGGTNSRANSIDDLGIVAGYSKPAGNAVRHAVVWTGNQQIFDLGSLGGAGFNSTVAWPVKNVVGLISGISETGAVNPLGEAWSCGPFFGTRGNICKGFVKSIFFPNAPMLALEPFAGGYNSYAAGTNDWGRTVGWAENGVHDATCTSGSPGAQVLGFKPAYWNYGDSSPHALPLLEGDTAGAATAINDRGQIVGLSGACDQAVGRGTAKHAVLWENGRVTSLGDIGGDLWNTPGAINERGDIAGFAGTRIGDVDATYTHAFLKLRNRPMQDLGVLPGDISSTGTGINLRGQVVGYSNDEAGVTRAFLWQNGEMMDLASLAPDFAGELVLANDIDDFGRIAGRGIDPATGNIVAFVAAPVH